MNTKIAKFAVVGHPNKGKSSIVSTLSHDDSIQISSRSGTTTEAKAFKVENKYSGYELIDTPGFQRPHKVLAWLEAKATSAEQRAKAVASFIADPKCQDDFPDEVQLLRPLVEGAAILYVVDGSRPYGNEYEAEMEILRWSGQPSMALINPIGSSAHIEPWKNALDQYFKLVRVFNPMHAEFDKQIELLQAFSHLNPEWTEHLTSVALSLKQHREQQKSDSVVILSRLIEDLCFHQQSQKILTKNQAKLLQPLLEKKYISWMVDREKLALQELFANYQHFQTKLLISELRLPPDLFDCAHWYMWGLDKKQLSSVAAIAGAATGAAVDLALAGSSFMIGAVAGGLAGFSSAWFGADKLLSMQLKGLPLGGYEANYGPITNKNFPYVVIGRFLYLHRQISQRSHALRGQLEIKGNELHDQISGLEKSSQKALHQACDKLVKQKNSDNDRLKQVLSQLF